MHKESVKQSQKARKKSDLNFSATAIPGKKSYVAAAAVVPTAAAASLVAAATEEIRGEKRMSW